jgi:hypothetical protein
MISQFIRGPELKGYLVNNVGFGGQLSQNTATSKCTGSGYGTFATYLRA